MYVYYNPNPNGAKVGDCVIRAIAKALNMTWDESYIDLSIEGLLMGDLPSSNAVWSAYLRHRGFKMHTIGECKDCYTLEDFCRDKSKGVFVVGTGSHAVAVIDGCYYDAWQSEREMPLYYFEKET